MLSRVEERFPTRSYPYRIVDQEAEGGGEATDHPLPANTLHRFVQGLDSHPRPLDAEDAARLGDPFARLLLGRGIFPLSLHALLTELDRLNGDAAVGLPQQRVFLAADGGQIPWTPETDDLARAFRFATARGRNDDFRLLISSSTVADGEEDHHFLQLIGWDEDNGVFHYYERRGGTWIWAGNSHHALAPETRGRGPFDSHVNGSLVMKELRQPWVHWHAPAAGIPPEALAPDDPLRNDVLFQNRVTADQLETTVVRPGIQRWNRARLARALRGDSTLTEAPFFFRQVLETTTVNLITTDHVSQLIGDADEITLPITFFLDADRLLDVLGLEPEIDNIRVSGRLYRNSLDRYDVHRTDGRHRIEGDTHFAFMIPEPAFEDTDVLGMLVRRGILTPRFAACLLMVDFPNPVFSQQRAALLPYVPETVRVSDLEERFLAAVRAATGATAADSPERQLLAHWALGAEAWKQEFEQRILSYVSALAAQAATEAGFDSFVRLAESRRRTFRRRPLAEFRLTTPITNIPEDAPALRMRADGTIEEIHL